MWKNIEPQNKQTKKKTFFISPFLFFVSCHSNQGLLHGVRNPMSKLETTVIIIMALIVYVCMLGFVIWTLLTVALSQANTAFWADGESQVFNLSGVITSNAYDCPVLSWMTDNLQRHTRLSAHKAQRSLKARVYQETQAFQNKYV